MRVRINTAVELAEVRHCSACGVDGYRIGLRFIAVSDEREPIALSRGAILGDLQIPLAQQPDRRQAPRQQLSRAVVVTVLGTGQRLQGEIRNFSPGGTQILLDRQLRVASPIKIEYAGKLLLGEVVYCRQERANWLLGIRIGNELSEVIALADAMGSQ